MKENDAWANPWVTRHCDRMTAAERAFRAQVRADRRAMAILILAAIGAVTVGVTMFAGGSWALGALLEWLAREGF